MSEEEHTEEESTSMEEEGLPQLAPPPEAHGVKRKLVDEYDANEREKKRLRANIKSMFVHNPGLEKQVGQHSEIDAKLSPLSYEELKAMCDECYGLCASGGQPYDPFSTARAATTILATIAEKGSGLSGLAHRIINDQRLIARIHEILPFDPQKAGPYVEAFASILSHGVNHLQQKWIPPPAPTPQPSVTSPTPPVSS